jgi:hypothetical protein
MRARERDALFAYACGALQRRPTGTRISQLAGEAGMSARPGFVQAGPCATVPGQGAMGFHYVHPGRRGSVPDVERPQALLYVPESGRLQPVGVEYIAAVRQDGQPNVGSTAPSSSNPAPRLVERAFDGPSPPRAPGAPWRYELHAWVWRDNPAGRSAPFNPAVSC